MSNNIKHNVKKTETKRGTLISRKPKKRFSQTKNKNLPVEQILHLQRTIGNRAVNQLIQSGTIQAKLTIGKPNDIYEKEADQVADRVMSMKDRSLVDGDSSLAQRETAGEEEKEEVQTKPLAEQITPLIQRQAEVEEEEEPVQTKLLQRQENEEEEGEERGSVDTVDLNRLFNYFGLEVEWPLENCHIGIGGVRRGRMGETESIEAQLFIKYKAW